MTGHGPIGLVVAMPSETRHLLAAATLMGSERQGPWVDQHLSHAGQNLVLVECGIGMVNAAAATEHLLATRRPRLVLNFGCAGAHRRDLVPGDVVIGTATVAHGAVQIRPDGSEHFPRHAGPPPRGDVGRELTLAPALVALAEAAAAGWQPAPWPASPPGTRPPLVTTGVVASADIWTQALARLEQLHVAHGSLCEDMEAAAIAQICYRHDVPFLTIKDISNNEFLAVSDLDSADAALPWAEVGARSAALILRLIARLPTT